MSKLIRKNQNPASGALDYNQNNSLSDLNKLAFDKNLPYYMVKPYEVEDLFKNSTLQFITSSKNKSKISVSDAINQKDNYKGWVWTNGKEVFDSDDYRITEHVNNLRSQLGNTPKPVELEPMSMQEIDKNYEISHGINVEGDQEKLLQIDAYRNWASSLPYNQIHFGSEEAADANRLAWSNHQASKDYADYLAGQINFNSIMDAFIPWNVFRPSQVIGTAARTARDLYNGLFDPHKTMVYLHDGNNGVFTTNYANKHPYLTTILNSALDVAALNPGGTANVVKGGFNMVTNPRTLLNNVLKPGITWTTLKAMPFVAKNVVMPTVAGAIVDKTERALTGTTLSEIASNYLLNEKGWNKFSADIVGGLLNPGYWINWGGTGIYTGPLFNKLNIGFGLSAKEIAFRQANEALVKSMIPKSKFQTRFVDPSLKYIDKNLYNIQRVIHPWLWFKKPKEVSSADLPRFKFVKNSEELKILNDTRFDPNNPGNLVLDYLLFNSNRNNEKVFGDAMSLKIPDFYTKFYDTFSKNSYKVDRLFTGLGAGASAADMMFFDNDNRSPWIKGLEYATLGRAGLNYLVNHRLAQIVDRANKYTLSFRNILSGIDDFFKKYLDASGEMAFNSDLASGNRYVHNFNVNMFNPRSFIESVKKPGFNYKKASFDDLVSFITKNRNLINGIEKLHLVDNLIYDSSGRVIAKKANDGSIELINELAIKLALSKDINLFDYNTGQHFTGKIEVDNDGNVVLPEEYINILQNNVDYVQNILFPGSNLKLYGSAAGVIDGKFPHATHDIDFYITHSNMDRLMKEDPHRFWVKRGDTYIPYKNVANPEKIDTWVYRINPEQYGDKGNIDLNIIKLLPNGLATGTRAEELYSQYFPDEYFHSLREFEAAKQNGKPIPFNINKTPEELLNGVNPSAKTVMDSFDIDFTRPEKTKHALRSLAHLIYTDPQVVAEGLNQYAKSKLGSRVTLFPMSAELFTDKELNVLALKKLGVNLIPQEMDRIASNPQRMKNFMDAWYLMDNTPMRNIRGTWYGVKGYTPENYILSATRWNPLHNGGEVSGGGLNFTQGDLNWEGLLKAYVSPYTEYKSDNLLDLIDEINYNFGKHPDAPSLLKSAGHGQDAEINLLKIYDETGWNFLRNGQLFIGVPYLSGTRPFDVNVDYVGFAPRRSAMHGLIPRITKLDPNLNFNLDRLNKTRFVINPIDYNKLFNYFSNTYPLAKNNFERMTYFKHPFHVSIGYHLGKDDIALNNLDNFTALAPMGIGGGIYGLTKNDTKLYIEIYKTLQDPIILKMSEEDRLLFTSEGVNSLYDRFKTDPKFKGVSQRTLDNLVLEELEKTYSKYLK